ncbi:MFS transporter [Desulfuromonas versatilis]|uniref:MFS transporter n=1 Tax=Desulfuromonas versatilis TaxID=2802975 RepID=A0ABN6DW18_9BACT|nr:MFS transporter [Desulfuromonas versatilis]BCR04340.1 MFS transporter [Desulfuromonas versatilis]
MDNTTAPGASRVHRWLQRLVQVEPAEIRALLWSFSYFFALLCSYYILRPMRDEMGIAGGVEHLQWLFTGTFLAMLAAVPLFGWVSSRYPRQTFLPLVYLFFIANLLLFFALFRSGLTHAWVARAFFIWTSVFNLFIVSVFWSFMADLFNNDQAKRLFGFIAAGGTAGALAGPALTATLAVPLGPTNLLLISAACLAWAMLCIGRLGAWREHTAPQPAPSPTGQGQAAPAGPRRGLGGGALAGLRLVARSPYLLGICLLILLYTTLSTFLYFQQAQIVRDSFSDPAQRTTVFAAMDFAANALTLAGQVFFTGRIVKRFGLGWALAVIPLLLGAGFLLLGLAPLLAVLIAVQVGRRAGNYAIMKPAREMLFVVLDRQEKYKAKNVIDTVIYRSGDVLSAWAYTGLQALGLGLSGIALLAVPIAGSWAWIGYRLGRMQEARAQSQEISP